EYVSRPAMTNIAPVLALFGANSPQDFPSRATTPGRSSHPGITKMLGCRVALLVSSRAICQDNSSRSYLEGYRGVGQGRHLSALPHLNTVETIVTLPPRVSVRVSCA